MTPPLFLLADLLEKENPSLTGRDVARARRDLEGLVGLKTAAARGHFKAEEVWAES